MYMHLHILPIQSYTYTYIYNIHIYTYIHIYCIYIYIHRVMPHLLRTPKNALARSPWTAARRSSSAPLERSNGCREVTWQTWHRGGTGVHGVYGVHGVQPPALDVTGMIFFWGGKIIPLRHKSIIPKTQIK